MYRVKNKIYADAGCVLKYKNKVAFSFEGVNENDVLETKLNLENIQKSKFVNKQFTNDDQIAIMLNKDDSEEDLLLFDKMQEWRA